MLNVLSIPVGHLVPIVAVDVCNIVQSASVLKSINCLDFICSQHDIEERNVFRQSLRL